MKNLFKALGLLVIVLVAVNSTLYVVSEFERGVKLRFGKLIEADIIVSATGIELNFFQ